MIETPREVFSALLDAWHKVSADLSRESGEDDEQSYESLEKQYERWLTRYLSSSRSTS